MRKSVLAAAVGLFFALSVPAAGQGVSIDLGPRLGVDALGDIEDVFIGADARFGIPALPVVLNPTFDYYFSDGFDFYQFSANALLDITSGALPNISPYVGAGLGISKASFDVEFDTPIGSIGGSGSNSDIGINLIAGGSVQAGGFKPFAQIQVTLLGDIDLVTVAVGTLFSLGG